MRRTRGFMAIGRLIGQVCNLSVCKHRNTHGTHHTVFVQKRDTYTSYSANTYADRFSILSHDTFSRDSYVGVTNITATPTGVSMALHPPTPIKPDARFYGVNLLCEVDVAGEYYINEQNGTLYVYNG